MDSVKDVRPTAFRTGVRAFARTLVISIGILVSVQLGAGSLLTTSLALLAVMTSILASAVFGRKTRDGFSEVALPSHIGRFAGVAAAGVLALATHLLGVGSGATIVIYTAKILLAAVGIGTIVTQFIRGGALSGYARKVKQSYKETFLLSLIPNSRMMIMYMVSLWAVFTLNKTWFPLVVFVSMLIVLLIEKHSVFIEKVIGQPISQETSQGMSGVILATSGVTSMAASSMYAPASVFKAAMTGEAEFADFYSYIPEQMELSNMAGVKALERNVKGVFDELELGIKTKEVRSVVAKAVAVDTEEVDEKKEDEKADAIPSDAEIKPITEEEALLEEEIGADDEIGGIMGGPLPGGGLAGGTPPPQEVEEFIKNELPKLQRIADIEGMLAKGTALRGETSILQIILQKLGYLEDKEGYKGGNYGSKTINAVKELQRKNGLKDDGRAGTDTIEAAIKEYKAPYEQIEEGMKEKEELAGAKQKKTKKVIWVTPHSKNLKEARGRVKVHSSYRVNALGALIDAVSESEKGFIGVGAEGEYVATLQLALEELGYKHAVHAGPKKYGTFDAGTDAALRGFQRDHGLKEDGFLGKTTLFVLIERSVEKTEASPVFKREQERKATAAAKQKAAKEEKPAVTTVVKGKFEEPATVITRQRGVYRLAEEERQRRVKDALAEHEKRIVEEAEGYLDKAKSALMNNNFADARRYAKRVLDDLQKDNEEALKILTEADKKEAEYQEQKQLEKAEAITEEVSLEDAFRYELYSIDPKDYSSKEELLRAIQVKVLDKFKEKYPDLIFNWSKLDKAVKKDLSVVGGVSPYSYIGNHGEYSRKKAEADEKKKAILREKYPNLRFNRWAMLFTKEYVERAEVGYQGKLDAATSAKMDEYIKKAQESISIYYTGVGAWENMQKHFTILFEEDLYAISPYEHAAKEELEAEIESMISKKYPYLIRNWAELKEQYKSYLKDVSHITVYGAGGYPEYKEQRKAIEKKKYPYFAVSLKAFELTRDYTKNAERSSEYLTKLEAVRQKNAFFREIEEKEIFDYFYNEALRYFQKKKHDIADKALGTAERALSKNNKLRSEQKLKIDELRAKTSEGRKEKVDLTIKYTNMIAAISGGYSGFSEEERGAA